MMTRTRTFVLSTALAGCALAGCTGSTTSTGAPSVQVLPTVVVTARPAPSTSSATSTPTGSVGAGARITLAANRVGGQRLGAREDVATTEVLTARFGEPTETSVESCRALAGGRLASVVQRRWSGFTVTYVQKGSHLEAVGWRVSPKVGRLGFRLSAEEGWEPRLAQLLDSRWTRQQLGDLVVVAQLNQPAYGGVNPDQRAALVFGGAIVDCS